MHQMKTRWLVWLGALGPSTTLCWERLARIASVRDDVTIDTADLAASLGLGGGMGRNAPISRTLGRMVAFGTAVRSGDTLAVRRALPDVPARMTGRLSHTARMAHEHWAKLSPQVGYVPPPVPSIEVGL